MFLEKLTLLNFKNYKSTQLLFNRPIVLINGDNGSGKTNLIDAIYYLAMCKSYFTRNDQMIVQSEQSFFRIDGVFLDSESNIEIVCKYHPDKRKEFFFKEILSPSFIKS